jgi:hypothetical protein
MLEEPSNASWLVYVLTILSVDARSQLAQNTHFRRLGTFKEYGVYDFLEQLVTYQGSCSWSQEQYSFLSSSYELFPQGCTLSSDGSSLYYDIKPSSGGKFSIGLYTDSVCTVNYKGSVTVEEVLQASVENNNNGDNDDGSSSQAAFASDEWFQQWNAALDGFKTCQPCMTMDVAPSSSNSRRRELNDDNGQCQEAINQCAMFAENTAIYAASFRDVRLATQQGSVVATHALSGVSPNRFKAWWTQWGFFTMSILVFFVGLVAFCCLVKVKKRPSLREPLLEGSNRNAQSSSRTVNSGKSKGSKTKKASNSSRSNRT